MTKTNLPTLRSYNLALVIKRIDRGLTLLRKYCGTTPTGVEFTAFMTDLSAVFKDKYGPDVLYPSVMSLAGTTLSLSGIRNTLWRLAGNKHLLDRGQPVTPWTGQTELEWVPVQLTSVELGRSKANKPGVYCAYRVLAGTPAGLSFNLFWTSKFARMLARHLGFTRGKGKLDYRLIHLKELTRMRLYLLLDPSLSRDDKPGYYHYHVPAASKKYNRAIIARRIRKIPCPLEYTRQEMPCHLCPIGYDRCPAGCHAKTYKNKLCTRCGEESWFDPANESPFCVYCS